MVVRIITGLMTFVISGTIFAYGQTASGKTHTMMGSRGEDGEPGLIPIALASIFHYMEEQSSHREFILRCSYLEIYNEVSRVLYSHNKILSSEQCMIGPT